MQLPFFKELSTSHSILLAGAGGGFDIVSGIPIYYYLRTLGKNVVLANLSFTELSETESAEPCPGMYHITADSKTIPYFPEKHMLQWLQARGEYPDMFGFSTELGVVPLSHAYSTLIQQYHIDTIILIDGGTDSLMFGDETGVATIVEDACSIIAASQTGIQKSYLVATGFGVEQFHHLDHYACLENIATLTKDGTYKGAVSLTSEMSEAGSYLELVCYLNQQMPSSESIVANSIASSIQGEFGNHHATQKTKGSELFINPFMSIYWFFTLQGIASKIKFASKIANSQTMTEVAQCFKLYRAMNTRRATGKIPF